MKIEVSYNSRGSSASDISKSDPYAQHFGRKPENGVDWDFRVELRDALAFPPDSPPRSLSDLSADEIWEWFKEEADAMTPRMFGEDVAKKVSSLVDAFSYFVMGTKALAKWDSAKSKLDQEPNTVAKYIKVAETMKGIVAEFNLRRHPKDPSETGD